MPETRPTRSQLTFLPPDEEAVHIYQADLDALGIQRPDFEAHLDAAERDRAAHFRRPLDRARFTTCRGQLREILSHYVGIPPADLAITCTLHGKPFLRDYPYCHFNIAHSQNLALFAVSVRHEVGIDIEQIRSDIPLETLIPRTLCEREAHLLHQHENNQIPIFLQFWTRKEALLKANGCGLSITLPEIDASNPNGQISLPHFDEEWYYHPITTFPNSIASLVTRGQNHIVKHHEL